MRIIANRFYIAMIYLLGIFIAFAAPKPPAPTHKAPPPPPSATIDGFIYYILIFAIIFGMYFIYKLNLKTKTPI